MKKIEINELPVFQLSINPEDEAFVNAVALVDEPAHHSMYLAFNDEANVKQFFTSDSAKQIVLGAAIIPDKLILRNPNNVINEYHFVKFNTTDIELMAKEFFKNGFHSNINIGHTDEKVNAYFFQSIIVGNELGQAKINGLDLPDGSWVLGAYISDKDTFNKVKEFGFSVEGLFKYKNDTQTEEAELIAELKKLMSNLDKYDSVPNTYKKQVYK